MLQRKRKNAGFSLVELIIVIAIMAILAGFLAPALIRYIEKSRRAVDLQAADRIQASLQRVLAETEFDPGNGQCVIIMDQTTTPNNPATCVQDELIMDLGKVPAIKSYPDYYWYIVYYPNTGSVPEVHLTDTATGQPLYELYPDNQAFADGQ